MGESKTIFGLSYDYHEKNGQYLLFTKKNQQELTEENIIHLQLRMMQSNQIPNLLPLSVEEIDFHLKLYYDITSKRQLNVYLTQHPLSSHEFYQLFMNILTTLEQSKLYMLNEHQYILKEEFIYLGKTSQQLYLTYVPVESLEKQTTTMEDLKELLGSLAKKVDSLQGSELNTINQYIENPSFNLAGLKELLLELQQLRPNPYQGYQSMNPQQPHPAQANGSFNQPQPSPQGHENSSTYEQGQEQNEPFDPFRQDPAKSNKTNVKEKKKKPKNKEQKPQGEPLTQRIKLYIGVGAALAIALVWKLFEMVPSQGIFYTAVTLSVLLLAAAVYFIFFFKTGVSKENKTKKKGQTRAEVAASNEQNQPINGYYQQVPQGVNSNGYANVNGSPSNYVSFNQGVSPQSQGYQQPAATQVQPTATATATAVATKPQVMPSFNEELSLAAPKSKRKPKPEPVAFMEEDHSLMMDTGLLSESDDTVLLGDDDFDEEVGFEITNPHLEVERDGELEQIELNQSHFTIGRNDSAVIYVEDSVGVSRVHVEFVRIEDSFGVKDLGSKNGTKLNGEALVPYKIYALQVDDIISVGKVDYTFKWE
ncbi:DUF6382 domain-containing protein [Alkalihalobacillus sp. 1P02AB]|uniref:DUF6382 domain-containing protein n=1 Tax=Alkalihalobacillus sp. 1P02AB TaxID=3132260 RepID=UPI0039A744AA